MKTTFRLNNAILYRAPLLCKRSQCYFYFLTLMPLFIQSRRRRQCQSAVWLPRLERFAFLTDWNMVLPLWNRRLHRELRLFKKLNPARIGGARAENQKASRFATARTRAPASVRRKLKLPKPEPSPGAAASTRKTARFATGATAGSPEVLPGLFQATADRKGCKARQGSVCFLHCGTNTGRMACLTAPFSERTVRFRRR
jgi:hypothetical protein